MGPSFCKKIELFRREMSCVSVHTQQYPPQVLKIELRTFSLYELDQCTTPAPYHSRNYLLTLVSRSTKRIAILHRSIYPSPPSPDLGGSTSGQRSIVVETYLFPFFSLTGTPSQVRRMRGLGLKKRPISPLASPLVEGG